MKKYMLWDEGQMIGIMDLYPDEVEMLTKNGIEVHEMN